MKKRQSKTNKKEVVVYSNEMATKVPVVEENHTRIKHLANLGDIVAVMAAMRRYWEVTGRKVILSQVVNTPAAYYQGAVHPTTNDDGTQVCVNNAMFEMMKPLVESQKYMAKMEKYEGQSIHLDFDVIRGKTFVGMPNLMIQSWIMYAYPDLACDLSKPWIELPEVKNHHVIKQVRNKVILNFTERYRNHVIDYYFLKKYAPNLVFAGTEREHFKFCNQWALAIPRLDVKNFLDYAYAIKHCRFLLGNQSLGWNLSQAMGTPRILEICQYAPNCQPFIGADSYGFYHQVGVEYYFRVLFDKE